MSSNSNTNQDSAMFFWFCALASLVSVIVFLFVGVITGSWGGEGDSGFCLLVTFLIAGGMSDPRPKNQRNTPLRNHPRHCMCLRCEYGTHSRRKS